MCVNIGLRTDGYWNFPSKGARGFYTSIRSANSFSVTLEIRSHVYCNSFANKREQRGVACVSLKFTAPAAITGGSFGVKREAYFLCPPYTSDAHKISSPREFTRASKKRADKCNFTRHTRTSGHFLRRPVRGGLIEFRLAQVPVLPILVILQISKGAVCRSCAHQSNITLSTFFPFTFFPRSRQ